MVLVKIVIVHPYKLPNKAVHPCLLSHIQSIHYFTLLIFKSIVAHTVHTSADGEGGQYTLDRLVVNHRTHTQS